MLKKDIQYIGVSTRNDKDLYEGVDSFGTSCLMLRITIYMETPYRYSAYRALMREVKLIFDRRGIKVPLNQIVVHEAHD
ncbi:MAG: hypothetical protein II883_07495 [Spirochaetales bacterium]|nr:hypothetical protein [Spirochaetales bacterium]MBQ3729109.1 hypothetical protein [Spirochaetales bacterium]